MYYEFTDEILLLNQKYVIPFKIGDYAYNCTGKRYKITGLFIKNRKVKHKLDSNEWINQSELYSSYPGEPCNIEEWRNYVN